MDLKRLLKEKHAFAETCNNLLVHLYYLKISYSEKATLTPSLREAMKKVYSEPSRKNVLPTTFRNFIAYFHTYYPLMLTETAAHLVSDALKTDYKEACKFEITRIITGVTGMNEKKSGVPGVNSKHTIEICLEEPRNREEDSLIINDFVLIMSDPKNPKYYMCGIVVSRGRNFYEIVVHPVGLRNLKKEAISNNQSFFVVLISNITSNRRDYMAFLKTSASKWMDLLLKPPIMSIDKESIGNFNNIQRSHMDTHFSELNDSQKTAISLALKRKITLIQGPPGTGKTRTISSLISMFLKRGMSVLVTAPSNVAVKTLVQYSSPWKDLFEKDKWVYVASERNKKLVSGSRSTIKISIGEKQETRTIDITSTDRKKHKKMNCLDGMKGHIKLTLCTLSMAGSPILKDMTYDVVIIDEACQATEYSALIPLLKCEKKMILVGDPMQLPPTIISDREDMRTSLFERLSKNISSYLLNTQYRMHARISEFPSVSFYNGNLLNGVERVSAVPVAFISVEGKEMIETKSLFNTEEATFIEGIIREVKKKYSSVTILSPYRAQSNYLSNSKIIKEAGVETSTIDGFQGQESDCIIISTVRTSSPGFLKDYRRTNVAITRARYMVIVVGRRKTLVKDKTWNMFIEYADRYKYLHENIVPNDFKKILSPEVGAEVEVGTEVKVEVEIEVDA